MTDWLERLNQLQTHRCLCILLPCYRVIFLTHHTSGWPETHSSMCTESTLQPPIQMPPLSRHSHTFKRAFAHLMMHDSFSVLFMPTDSVWVAVQTGWSCVCVCGREEVEQDRGPGKSDCVKLLLTGKWGVGKGLRVQGTETNKEWSYWRLKGSCTRNSSVLIGKRISRVKVWTDRWKDRQTHTQTRSTMQIMTFG